MIPYIFLSHPSVSLLELQYVPSLILTHIPSDLWWIIRLLHALIISYSILRLSKLFPANKRAFSMILLGTMPWLIVVAHEFNPYTSFFILFLTLFITTPSRKREFGIGMGIVLVVLLLQNTDSLPNALHSRAYLFVQSFNLTQLFMQMEPVSSYLKIPRNGYFHIVSLITLLVFIYRSFPLIVERLKPWTIPLIGSTLFFFLFPSDHLVLAGVGLLLLGSLMIVQGALAIVESTPWTKPLLLIALFVSTLFFFETYLRQYPVMYAGERSEGKFNVIEYVRDNSADTYYLPDDHDLKYLATIYARDIRNKNIQYVSQQTEWMTLYATCQKDRIVCILDEGAIREFSIQKDDSSITPIRLKNYLSVYYVL
ncbi:hypothetical protein KBD81_00880 [Candidatus Woesebacteria bacterium]|nr:hypothetical protein [Candidatus Woesebacteria bacterium]